MDKKKILIDAEINDEIKVVIMQNGQSVSFLQHFEENRSSLGNIYLATVERLENSLNAAFVNYGEKRSGFLPLSEVNISACKQFREERFQKKAPDNPSNPAHDAADQNSTLAEGNNTSSIQPGQLILVQIQKEERGHKGCTLTTNISLSGRFCSIYPYNGYNKNPIPYTIKNHAERDRLLKITQDLSQSIPTGSISITELGEFKTKKEIQRDFEYLKKIWKKINKTVNDTDSTSFIYQEPSIGIQTIREMSSNDIDKIVIFGPEMFQQVKQFLSIMLPQHLNKLEEFKGNDIFAHYNIHNQINNLSNQRVSLKSGGHIVIQQTEALVVIDVNSGQALKQQPDQVALNTNIEAAEEIALQIRLRDLSGIIVIDFIDMPNKTHKNQVLSHFSNAIKGDKSHIKVGKISDFGLLELTRQRGRQGFYDNNIEKCHHCNGRGYNLSLNHRANNLIRMLLRYEKNIRCTIYCHETLLNHILNHKAAEIHKMKVVDNKNILFHIDKKMNYGDYSIQKERSSNYNSKAISDVSQISYKEENNKGTKDPGSEEKVAARHRSPIQDKKSHNHQNSYNNNHKHANNVARNKHHYRSNKKVKKAPPHTLNKKKVSILKKVLNKLSKKTS